MMCLSINSRMSTECLDARSEEKERVSFGEATIAEAAPPQIRKPGVL